MRAGPRLSADGSSMAQAAQQASQTLTVVLFLSGGTPSSERARTAVHTAMAQAGVPDSALETVDVRVNPQRAMRDGAIVVPMVRVISGQESRWYAGDFEDVRDLEALFAGLA